MQCKDIPESNIVDVFEWRAECIRINRNMDIAIGEDLNLMNKEYRCD